MQKAGCDNADQQLIQCPAPWSALVELDLLQTCKLNVPKTQYFNSFDLVHPLQMGICTYLYSILYKHMDKIHLQYYCLSICQQPALVIV